MSRLREINNLAAEIISGSYFQGGHRIANKNAKKIFSLSEPVELNENQQIVLEYLKKSAGSKGSLLIAICSLVSLSRFDDSGERYEHVRTGYQQLIRKQEVQVLQAFAEWGLNHDRN